MLKEFAGPLFNGGCGLCVPLRRSKHQARCESASHRRRSFLRLSRVMGSSATPARRRRNKVRGRAAITLGNFAFESSAGSPAISAARVIFALCSMVSFERTP